MTPNKNLEYYEKSDIAFMSFLMIWEPGSSGIEFFGKFQYYFPGGRRFWTLERSGEVNLRFLSIFVIFENLYSHNKSLYSQIYIVTLWQRGRERGRQCGRQRGRQREATREAMGKVGGALLSGDPPRLK